MKLALAAVLLVAACSDGPGEFSRLGHWRVEWDCHGVSNSVCVPPELFGSASTADIAADGAVVWTDAGGATTHQATDDGVCFDVAAGVDFHTHSAYSVCPDEPSNTMSTIVAWDVSAGTFCGCVVVLRR